MSVVRRALLHRLAVPLLSLAIVVTDSVLGARSYLDGMLAGVVLVLVVAALRGKQP